MHRVKRFLANQSAQSFEMMFAFWFVVGGLIAMFAVPPLATCPCAPPVQVNAIVKLLGQTAGQIFNGAFIVAGIAMFFGAGFNRRDLEASGLVVVIAALALQLLARLWIGPVNAQLVNPIVFYSSFIVSCGVRFHGVLKGKRVFAV